MLLKRIEPNLVNYFTKYTKESKVILFKFSKSYLHTHVCDNSIYIYNQKVEATNVSVHACMNKRGVQTRKETLTTGVNTKLN